MNISNVDWAAFLLILNTQLATDLAGKFPDHFPSDGKVDAPSASGIEVAVGETSVREVSVGTVPIGAIPQRKNLVSQIPGMEQLLSLNSPEAWLAQQVAWQKGQRQECSAGSPLATSQLPLNSHRDFLPGWYSLSEIHRHSSQLCHSAPSDSQMQAQESHHLPPGIFGLQASFKDESPFCLLSGENRQSWQRSLQWFLSQPTARWKGTSFCFLAGLTSSPLASLPDLQSQLHQAMIQKWGSAQVQYPIALIPLGSQ